MGGDARQLDRQDVSSPAEVRAAFDMPFEKRTEVQKRALMEVFLAHDKDEESKAHHATVAALRAQEPKIRHDAWSCVEREEPRATHVHLGGDFTRKGDAVAPGRPRRAAPAGGVGTRRTGSTWPAGSSIPRNPLTARVTVNRLWQAVLRPRPGRDRERLRHAGDAARRTPSCSTGWPPSSSRRGWSLKAMHRLIVTSATYRQSSQAPAGPGERRPANRLLARQSRLRLDAEIVRDAALAASGLLTPEGRRPERLPAAARRRHDASRQMKREWTAEHGPGPLPPRAVHLLLAGRRRTRR